MARIYLFRHGLAVPHGTEGFDDDERPLTPKGERRVRQVARGLKRLRPRLDAIVTSPLPRAAKTAEIAADVLGVAFLLEDSTELLPTASPESIHSWLKTREEPGLMLVGHNPNLSGLLTLLTTGQSEPALIELRKAGVAALLQGPGDRYQVDWISRPRLLRKLS